MLVGERIRVRPFEQDELALVKDWFNSRELAVGPWQPYILGQGEQVVRALSGNLTPTAEGSFLAIERLDSGAVVGFVRFTMQAVIPGTDGFYDIGYAITDLESRGKGYAREACTLVVDYLFATYPVERIGAFTVSTNEPSIHLLERLGFVREGAFRHTLYFDGRWHDVVSFAVLRDEWQPDGR